jgi:hypothetical protein
MYETTIRQIKSKVLQITSWFQIKYSKLHVSLLCFKLQGRSWCIPPSVTTKLVDHRSVPMRRQPERITPYQLIQGHLKTWLAGRMQADERGRLLIFLLLQWQKSIPKNC